MKTITFFSYKGGAGRSTLAYNTIPILAKEHIHPTAASPMIVLDTDIDSCGMTYLLDKDDNPVNVTAENCVQTLFAEGCTKIKTPTVKEHPYLGKLCPVGHSYGLEDNDAILLVPAMGGKRIDENSSSNYTDSKSPIIPRMEQFIDFCYDMKVSAVLIDSAVGDNLSAIVSNEISDVIVCCMRPTRQFREGTVSYLKRIENNRISSGKDIIIMPNVIPTGETVIDNQRYPDEALYQINSAFERLAENSHHNYHLDFTQEDCFGVPALARFMWCEEILANLSERTSEEEAVYARYKKLAEVIAGIEDDD